MTDRPEPIGPAGIPWGSDAEPGNSSRTDSGRRGPAWQATLSVAAEVVWVGILSFVTGLVPGLVVAGLSAGIAHLRRHRTGGDDSSRAYFTDVRRALGSWPYSLAVGIVSVLMVANLALVGSGAVPGGTTAALLVMLAGATVWVVVLRTAAAWTTEQGERSVYDWSEALAIGARTTVSDLVGTVLLVSVMVMSAVMVWFLVPAVVLVPGVMCWATSTVVHRGSPKARTARRAARRSGQR